MCCMQGGFSSAERRVFSQEPAAPPGLLAAPLQVLLPPALELCFHGTPHDTHLQHDVCQGCLLDSLESNVSPL